MFHIAILFLIAVTAVTAVPWTIRDCYAVEYILKNLALDIYFQIIELRDYTDQ